MVENNLIGAPLVIVESPYRGKNYEELDRNISYARACMRDCVLRGEAPFASHLLYTQEGILDDKNPDERNMGITAGFAWRNKADKTVVYTDLIFEDWSHYRGIVRGVAHANSIGQQVDIRRLSDDALTKIDPEILQNIKPFSEVEEGLNSAVKIYSTRYASIK